MPEAGSIDHRRAIAEIDAETRARLLEQSDLRGLIQLGLQWSLIAVCGWGVASGVQLWPSLLLPLGILIMFQFTALHEATHQTAFRTPWLNTAAAHVSGVLVLVAPEWFRYFHFAHHRHTQDPERDPELDGGKPDTIAKYLLYLSGLAVWKGNVAVLLRNAMGRVDYDYVAERPRRRLVTEARLLLLGYGTLLALSLWVRSTLLLWVWVVPALIGQPFLRAYLLAERTHCPLVANMLENSRTTFTTAVVRFVAWNMPYHAEYHSWPQVPFWRLPDLHTVLAGKLLKTERGYVRFHGNLWRSLNGGGPG